MLLQGRWGLGAQLSGDAILLMRSLVFESEMQNWASLAVVPGMVAACCSSG
jgi:hypothetical protein